MNKRHDDTDTATGLRRILCAVDRSNRSRDAFAEAAALARQHGARLILAPLPGRRRSLDDHQLLSVRASLWSLKRRADERGMSVDIVSPEDADGLSMRDIADRVDADLIVVPATRARSLLARVARRLLPGPAERLLRGGDRPILLARPGPREPGYYKNVLIPTDLDGGAEPALASTADVAAPGSHVELLHCSHPVARPAPQATMPPVQVPPRERVEDLVDERARAVVSAAESALPGAEIEFDHVFAPAASGIRRRMAEDQFDLIVMRSHARSGVRRLLFGSVAEETLRAAPCSVLVVPDRSPDRPRPGELA